MKWLPDRRIQGRDAPMASGAACPYLSTRLARGAANERVVVGWGPW